MRWRCTRCTRRPRPSARHRYCAGCAALADAESDYRQSVKRAGVEKLERRRKDAIRAARAERVRAHWLTRALPPSSERKRASRATARAAAALPVEGRAA